MTTASFAAAFDPLLKDIAERATVTDVFVDRDLYRLYLATLWTNVVLNPADVGLTEADLEPLHDFLNDRIGTVLGNGATITDVFRFVNSRAGESAMQRAKLGKTHVDMLLYFASMILDPDRHKLWLDRVRENQSAPS